MASNKQKTKKLPLNSSADSGDDSEHELFHYANDRIRLMKEVIKLIKPKKIKAIAPGFMKDLDIDEINSILLEELLGISNKRLKHILNGDNIDTVSTSSDSELEQPIDVISLDDISDTDDEFGLGSINTSNEANNKDLNNKKSHTDKKAVKEIKKEKGQHSKMKESQVTGKVNVKETENDKLMNVLEILELQARARAIRSQLALENISKKAESAEQKKNIAEDDDDDTAVIVNSPKNEEIVITSSDEEGDKNQEKSNRRKIDKENKTVQNYLNNDEQDIALTKKDQASVSDCNVIDTNKAKEENQHELVGKEPSDVIIINDASNEKQSADLNVSSDDARNKSGISNKDDTTYKSDSDNDVINLDSEDIENV